MVALIDKLKRAAWILSNLHAFYEQNNNTQLLVALYATCRFSIRSSISFIFSLLFNSDCLFSINNCLKDFLTFFSFSLSSLGMVYIKDKYLSVCLIIIDCCEFHLNFT